MPIICMMLSSAIIGNGQLIDYTYSTGGRLSVVWDAKLHNPEHIGYGADWKKNSNIIATCSFYNHLMQLWRLVL